MCVEKLAGVYLQTMIDSAFIQRIFTNLEFLSIQKEDIVLDCGCGSGVYVQIISEDYNCQIIGIDVRASELLVAKERTRNWSRKVEFVLCDARYLPFRNIRFTKVLCTEVLEHISDDVGTLREIRRVIRKDGLLVLSVPNANYPFLWDPVNKILERIHCRPIKSGLWSGIWGGHFRLYKEASLIAKLGQAGFNTLKKRHLGRICLPFNYLLLYVLTGAYFRIRKTEKISQAQACSFAEYFSKKKYSLPVLSRRVMELISKLNRRFVFQNPSLNIAICAGAQ